MKLSRIRIAGVFSFLLALSYVACTHMQRAPSSHDSYAEEYKGNLSPDPVVGEILENDAHIYGGKVKFTPGLTADEAIDLWHLSEGSEVYPLAWMIRMKSQFSNLAGKTYLHENLDKKFGIIPESKFMAEKSEYPFKWVGMTAAWSEAHPTEADVKLAPGRPLDEVAIAKNNGRSIAMVGVNCAFCHTNEITIRGNTKLFEGAPAMINIRGFFQDMFASTAKTMLTQELLEEFLGKFPTVSDPKAVSTSFVTKFKKELGVDTYGQRKAGEAIAWVDEEFYNNKKTTTLRETFYKKKHIVAKYLQTLLQITYGMNVVPNELNLRMEFLANSIGINPNLATTPEGFSRTDAFGRIANLVARTKNPIPLTATASVPPMWNIQYKSLFHWNANTNSVVMRNLGQSFGLGAIKTNPNGTGSAAYDTTANLHNLHRLENLLYKIQTPRLEQLTDEINIAKAINGCNIYHKTCVRCHLPKRERVGPQQELVEYKMLPLNHLKTDSVYSENQAKPVEVSVPMKSGLKGKPDPEKPGNIIIEVPFKDALFAFTKGVRGRYYERYNVPMSDQLEWQKASLRGEELFRDTIKGEKGHTGHSAYFNIDEKPTPGYPARHLAGVWATAPYLHNGSVPSIYDLLKPADKRPKLFFVGSREYDDKVLGFRSDIGGFDLPDLDAKAMEFMNYKPGLLTWAFANPPKRPKDITEAKVQYVCHTYPERCFSIDEIGNSNKGHEGPFFGTELNHDQKMELIEFLKILRPEPEYSFNGFSPYKFDGEKCVEVTR